MKLTAKIIILFGVINMLVGTAFAEQFVHWNQQYDGSGSEYGYSILNTTDGNIIIPGHSYINNNTDAYIVKTDAQGDTIWTRLVGGTGSDNVKDVVETTSGAYLFGGTTNSTGAGDNDFWLIKMNPDGTTLATYTYGSTGREYLSAIEVTRDGNYLLVGSTWTPDNSSSGTLIIKVDSDGNEIWSSTRYESLISNVISIIHGVDDGYIILGGSGGDPNTLIIEKIDESGNLVWSQYYGGTTSPWTHIYGRAIIQSTELDGYLIVGAHEFWEPDNNYLLYLLKVDATGDSLWSKIYSNSGQTYSHSQSTFGKSLIEYNNNYLIAGETGPYGSSSKCVESEQVGADSMIP